MGWGRIKTSAPMDCPCAWDSNCREPVKWCHYATSFDIALCETYFRALNTRPESLEGADILKKYSLKKILDDTAMS